MARGHDNGCRRRASPELFRVEDVADGLRRVLGGGKGVGYVAPFLARNGCRIIGIYMTGANEDHLSDGYAKLRPGADFLNTPIYVSAGHEDRIATLEQQYAVVGIDQANRL